MSDKYIKLDDVLQFPIRRDHCDKDNADPGFINGIETVFEFIENLPVYEMTAVANKQNQLSFEERTFCLNYIQELLQERSNQFPHFKKRFVNFDSYKASELRHKILEHISDQLVKPGKNREFTLQSGVNGLTSEINMFLFHYLLHVGDTAKLKLVTGLSIYGTIEKLDGTVVTIQEARSKHSYNIDAAQIKTFEVIEEATLF